MARENLFEKIDGIQALRLLREGNRRFVQGSVERGGELAEPRRLLAEKGQAPFAVILSCSDSRVPPELVFDVGLGELFVVRTAGNVADSIAIGSVEYAVEHLGTRLVVVMGHSGCGAVAAAVAGGSHSPAIDSIVAEISPSLEKLRAGGEGADAGLASRCEDENVRHTIARLQGSSVLSEMQSSQGLLIVGAKYNLATGEVEFLV